MEQKPRALIVRLYAARLIDVNEYLVETLNKRIRVTEINELLLKSMPTSWSIQDFVQGFDCEYITFKKAVNIFECMEISESI